MVKEAALHVLCAMSACEALDALRHRPVLMPGYEDPHDLEELKTRFDLVLEELGSRRWNR